VEPAPPRPAAPPFGLQDQPLPVRRVATPLPWFWHLPRYRSPNSLAVSLIGFSASLWLMTWLLIAIQYLPYGYAMPLGSVAGILCFLLMPTFGLLYYLDTIRWAWQVHKDLRFITGDAYPITPGTAVGPLFVPGCQSVHLALLLWRMGRHAFRGLGRAPEVERRCRILLNGHCVLMVVILAGGVAMAVEFRRLVGSPHLDGYLTLRVEGLLLTSILVVANVFLARALLVVGKAVGEYVHQQLMAMPGVGAPPWMPVAAPDAPALAIPRSTPAPK
jgi:hypothetical protein